MSSPMRVSRRAAVGLGALSGALMGCSPAEVTTKAAFKRPPRALLRDRTWIWGHGARTLNGQSGIPDGKPLGEVAAARSLGVSNLAVIRWSGKPQPPYDAFVSNMAKLPGAGWSVVDSAPESTASKIDAALAIADEAPNLNTLWLDDLFILPMKITPAELDNLRIKAHNRPRPLDLNAVVYVTQMADAGIDLSPLDKVDVVTLWAWDGSDIDLLPEHFARFRKAFPPKRMMLGVYMWDFGASRPIGLARMQRQLDLALQWMKSGEIEGVVFHSTPLVGRPIAEVDMARGWIAKNGATFIR